MNQLSRLKNQIVSWFQVSDPLASRSNRQFYVLATLLIMAAATLLLFLVLPLFSIELSGSALVLALVALLGFAGLYPWLESLLEQRLWPERVLGRQLLGMYSQAVRQTADLETLLPYVAGSLRQHLAAQSVSLWLYQAEDRLLVLAHSEGTLAADLAELPVDLSPGQLPGTQPVLALPESALRQGLLLLGVEQVAALNLQAELVGLIGLSWAAASLRPSPGAFRAFDWLTGPLALAVKNARLIADLADTLDKLQLAYRRTIDAQEEERRNLAVELHDDILSRLTTMGLTLSQSQHQLAVDPAQIQPCLEALSQETRSLNSRLREITQGLHPAVLTDLGLIAALQAYMDSLSKHALPATAPRTIDLTAQGFDNARLADSKLERDIYYITRQALDNAIKHAQAEQIFIHLRWRDDAVTVTVQDTGIGLKAAPELLMGQQGHLGLLSLQERTLAWGGRLSFQTGPGQGTTVYARLPAPQPSPNPGHLQAFTHYLRSKE